MVLAVGWRPRSYRLPYNTLDGSADAPEPMFLHVFLVDGDLTCDPTTFRSSSSARCIHRQAPLATLLWCHASVQPLSSRLYVWVTDRVSYTRSSFTRQIWVYTLVVPHCKVVLKINLKVLRGTWEIWLYVWCTVQLYLDATVPLRAWCVDFHTFATFTYGVSTYAKDNSIARSQTDVRFVRILSVWVVSWGRI